MKVEELPMQYLNYCRETDESSFVFSTTLWKQDSLVICPLFLTNETILRQMENNFPIFSLMVELLVRFTLRLEELFNSSTAEIRTFQSFVAEALSLEILFNVTSLFSFCFVLCKTDLGRAFFTSLTRTNLSTKDP